MSEPDYKAQRDALLSALKECEGMLDRGTYGDAMRLIPIVREAIRDAEAQG